jgi:predicted dehydrogenase
MVGINVIRGAIVGFGKAAVQAHLPAFQKDGKIAISAVVETARERHAVVRSLLPAARIYTSLAECLHQEQLEFVDIVTPPTSHASLVAEACRWGLHVLCEKPLALSIAELKTIKRLAVEKELTVFTVHNWKYAPPFQRMKDMIQQGRIGKPFYVELQTFRRGPAIGSRSGQQGADWRLDPRLSGGGILIDHGWHAFYLLMHLCDQSPQTIDAVLARYQYQGSLVEDTADCWVHFPAALGHIYLTWAAYTRLNLALVCGPEGLLRLNDHYLELCLSNGTGETFSFSEALSAHSYHPDWMLPMLEDFQEEIHNPQRRGTNLQEAEACLLLLTAAYHSQHKVS